jgi:hypothetical protein
MARLAVQEEQKDNFFLSGLKNIYSVQKSWDNSFEAITAKVGTEGATKIFLFWNVFGEL